jgi:hypothetical protein
LLATSEDRKLTIDTWCWQSGLDLDMTAWACLGASNQCAGEIFANTVIEALVARAHDPA